MNRELIVKGEFLGHVPDGALDLLSVVHRIEPVDPGHSFRWLQNATEHPDNGRFPRAIRAEKPKDGPFGNRETHSVHGSEFTKPFGQILALDHCTHGILMGLLSQ